MISACFPLRQIVLKEAVDSHYPFVFQSHETVNAFRGLRLVI